MVNGIDSLISLSDFSLLVYRNASDFCVLILYPKDAIRKLLELISEFIKVLGYKIYTQKSLAFLYTNNEKPEKEIK